MINRSIQKGWWESIDMADALHPQTLLTYGMNGTDLPVAFGGSSSPESGYSWYAGI